MRTKVSERDAEALPPKKPPAPRPQTGAVAVHAEIRAALTLKRAQAVTSRAEISRMLPSVIGGPGEFFMTHTDTCLCRFYRPAIPLGEGLRRGAIARKNQRSAQR